MNGLKFKRQLSLFLLILTISCTNSKYEKYLKADSCLLKTEGHFLNVLDTLDIHVPTKSLPYFPLAQALNNRYLIGLDKTNSKFEIYDLKKENYLKSINVDPNFITKLGAFYAHTLDSIFVTQDIADVLLINGEGVIEDKWDLSSAPVNWESPDPNLPEYFFYSSAYSVPYFDGKTKNLHVTFNCTDIWYFSNKSEYQMHGVFNTVENKWKTVFGKSPGIYGVDGDFMYPFAYSQPYQLVVGNKTFISYPMDHYIYVYNNTTGKLVEKRCASSQYIDKLPDPLNYNEGSEDFQLRINMVNTASVYGTLNYHQDINKFSRIVAHRQAEKNSMGGLNHFTSKDISIILFDEHLNVLGEQIISNESEIAGVGGDHGVSLGVVTDDGFIGSQELNQVKSDDFLRYSIKLIINEGNAHH